MNIESYIRDIPDFPKKGVIFKDITPLLNSVEARKEVINRFIENLPDIKIDKVVGIESRGFFFGILLAQELGVGFVPVRKKGKERIAPKYDDTDAFSEGLAAVKLNGKWGFVNQEGKETIPIQYYMVGTFSEGLVAVTKSETTKDFQWLFVDNKGKTAIPIEFEGMFAPVFKDSKAKVRKDGKTFYIDKTGKEVK